MSVKELYNFSESRFLTLSHELRVYIFGADVTPWLRGDLSVTYGSRDSFNTVAFELANPKKIWQLTKDNLAKKWRRSGDEYSEQGKLSVFRIKNDSKLNPAFTVSTIGQDYSGSFKGEAPKISSVGLPKDRLRVPSENSERPYRLAVNDCIFSKHDPIRIFMKNPYRIEETKKGKPPPGEWMEVFCGFVQEHPITTNHLTGESTLRINGYCIKQMLNRMRVRVNPFQGTDIDKQPQFSKGFYADFVHPSTSNHPYAISTLENTIKELILGSSTLKAGQKLKKDEANGKTALGDFRMGNTICYDPKAPGNTLENWHLMTMFGVNKVAFPTGPGNDLWLTTEEMSKVGESTVISEDYYAPPPSGRYLHLLLPIGGTGAAKLVQSTIDQATNTKVEWTSKWDIIREFAGHLDFQVLTSPSGDILVEFPMYGFTPHLFSPISDEKVKKAEKEAEVKCPTFDADDPNCSWDDLRAGSSRAARSVSEQLGDESLSEEDRKQEKLEQEEAKKQAAKEQKVLEEKNAQLAEVDTNASPVGMARIFTFDHHQLEETLSDETGEDIDTILQVDGGMALTESNLETPTTNTQPRAWVYSPVLVGRYGVTSGQFSVPFAGQKSSDQDSNNTLGKRLSRLALIEYMKRLADIATWDGSVVYRPFLFPNRPMWLKKSARMGLTTSVTNRWTIGKGASTNIGLHMLMAERYDPDTGKSSYRLPTGSVNMPIDYAKIWNSSEDDIETGTSDSGVVVNLGDGTDNRSDAKPGSSGASERAQPTPSSASSGVMKSLDMGKQGFIYPPFAEAMKKAIADAAKKGMAVSITSGYRSPAQQMRMKTDPANNGVARRQDDPTKFVTVGEPWKSGHQYGLSLDVSVSGRRFADFSTICQRYNILWYGLARPGDDDVHFDWISKFQGKGSKLKAIMAEKKITLEDTNNLGRKHLDIVWGILDGNKPKKTQSELEKVGDVLDQWGEDSDVFQFFWDPAALGKKHAIQDRVEAATSRVKQDNEEKKEKRKQEYKDSYEEANAEACSENILVSPGIKDDA